MACYALGGRYVYMQVINSPNNYMAHNQQSATNQKQNMNGLVSDDTLWVGKRNIGISDDIFVYDSEMNNLSSGTIYLFSIRLNWMHQFQKDGLREYFSKVSDPVINKMAIEKYINWKTEHGNEFTKIHPTSDEQKLQIVVEKHKEYINKIQKTYLGFSKSTNKILRVTVCFSCKEPLDNRIDIECNACGWIICNRCGACGCDYDPSKRKGFY